MDSSEQQVTTNASLAIEQVNSTGSPQLDYHPYTSTGILNEQTERLHLCCSTKTQVNPSSALNRTKHHQSNPSNVPGIPNTNLLKRACVYTPKLIDHKVRPDPSSITGSGPQPVPLLLPDSSLLGFLSPGFTTSLVYLTSVEHVRGVSLCS